MAGQYLSKGSRVYMDGKLETRDWQDKDGNKRYTTEINVLNMIFLGNSGGQRHQTAPPQGQAQGRQQHFENHQPPPSSEYELNDDIPF